MGEPRRLAYVFYIVGVEFFFRGFLTRVDKMKSGPARLG